MRNDTSYWEYVRQIEELANAGETESEIVARFKDLWEVKTGFSFGALRRNARKYVAKSQGICPHCHQPLPIVQLKPLPDYWRLRDQIRQALGIEIFDLRATRIIARMLDEGRVRSRSDLTFAKLIVEKGCGRVTAQYILDAITERKAT